ncbi:SAC3/GANP/Nin1/mts3/eIF-3 p25 family-domain-containing protein [Crassisporium funariophilum]|nr:SAC3/GANP/Nin1/mts3/eIF-3 p25 family-domain-containing protein [Crassisporium funariophilum]
MDGFSYPRGRGRGRGATTHDLGPGRERPLSRNKHWTPNDTGSRSNPPNHVDNERWERGGHRGGGRGVRGAARGAPRKFHNVSLRLNNHQRQPEHNTAPFNAPVQQEEEMHTEEEGEEQEGEEEFYETQDNVEVVEQEQVTEPINEIHEPELETAEERERFYQELVKAREVERKKAIAEGKMDDPLVAKRLEDAISIVGTCMDMCPRFERYRRERENNLFEWETIPGTKRVNHNRAVKMYERAAGDKTLPSDLRPPHVLKRTLDYLFHDLLPRGGFSQTFNFIRDRSRSVRNDFTMQHITGALAIECHDRCARFHILALHFERDRTGFSIPLEEQQLMNTLQSLKEFYEDQRGRYESPSELEMRVYHRLIHIRDQKERHEDIPECITSHPVFQLTTDFRLHVQRKSAPISKTSKLVVDAEALAIFGQLANVLREQGSVVMIYLVACILERLFGKETIDDIEAIRGDLSISDVIDGVSTDTGADDDNRFEEVGEEEMDDEVDGNDAYGDYDAYEEEVHKDVQPQPSAAQPLQPSATQWLSSNFNNQPLSSTPAPSATPVTASAFAGLVSTPNVFGTPSVFGPSSVFGTTKPTSVFGPSVFGNSAASSSTFEAPAAQPASSFFSSGPNLLSNNALGTGQSPQPAPAPRSFFDQSQKPGSPAFPPSTMGNTSTETPKSIFGGSSVSPFMNGPPKSSPFPSSAPSTVPPPPSLNPLAPSFTPPQPSSSTFFPKPVPTPSGSAKSTVPSAFMFTPPTINGAGAFSRPSATSTPPSFPSKTNQGTSSLTATPTSQTRLTAPPLLKIDTNTSTGSSSASSAVASPKVPPLLAKQQPIPLPSTPTTLTQPPSALLGHLRQTLDGPWGVPSTPEALSPLIIGSPSASGTKHFHNFSPVPTLSPSKRFKQDISSSLNGKGKARETFKYDDDDPAVKEMENKALTFERRSTPVKECFQRWLKHATDRAAWLEACRHSDAYRERVKGRQRPLPNEKLDKKRTISRTGAPSDDSNLSPVKKRARRRISAEYHPPRTDEELARRLKENHTEHELRWAQGSFLEVIRKHIKDLNPSTLKLPWQIWLSMNPESDATAIWLEKKFDVPESGSWVSEFVFAIPLSSSRASAPLPSPGVIIFECTPLGDVTDNLEKKYRILDDCSRLRNIIKAFPAKRRFIPSLLILCWTEEGETYSASDLFDMAKKLVADSVLQSYHVFAMTSVTKDLDNKLHSALSSLDLDTSGKLVQDLTLRGVFKVFEPAFKQFLDEWIENCGATGRFNWSLYGQLVQASITSLNAMSELVKSLLELQGQLDPLPSFNHTLLDDSESAYDDANDWLSNLTSRDDARMVATDLQSHRNIGQDFPARIFIEHLFEVVQTRFQRLYPKTSNAQHPIPNSSITSSVESLKDIMRPHQMKLLQTYNFSVRRSPKRRAYSVTASILGSPEAKRPRLSASIASTDDDHSAPSSPPLIMNGRHTPSPTNSTVSLATTEEPTVTVAMLRALTRDLKKKYVGS